MRRFLLRRLLWLALTVWALITLSFCLMRAGPGGPSSSERLAPALEADGAALYHLDWPLWRRYFHYLGPLNLDERGLFGDRSRLLGGALCGDLGPSLRQRDFRVDQILAQSLPVSIELSLLALLGAIAVGLPAGILAGLVPRSRADVLLRTLAMLGTVLPNFVIAALLLLVLALWLRVLPVAGYGSARHLVLPAIALGAPFAACIARLARAGLLEALARDHIRTAIAFGLPPWRIVVGHALQSACLPVVSYLGPAAAGVLTGSLVIERIFAIPGAGSQLVGSALAGDYTLALGVTLVYTLLVYTLNTLVDLFYPLLDPRIALEEP